jgi:hypothetical protein
MLFPVMETNRTEDRQQTTSQEVKEIVNKYNSSRKNQSNVSNGTDNNHGIAFWIRFIFIHLEHTCGL